VHHLRQRAQLGRRAEHVAALIDCEYGPVSMSAPAHSRVQRVSAVMREGERVTPLELFFDLVFVLAIVD